MAYKSVKDDNDYGHVFVDTSTRFQEDQLLRSFGFEIFARPKHGPSWWSYKSGDGCKYTHSEALDLVRKASGHK